MHLKYSLEKPILRNLEAAITRHCINTCRNCNHFSQLHKPYFMDIDVLRRDILAITEVAKFKKFAILGGEPLLHPKIDNIVEMIKSLNLFETVEMTTNGQILDRVSDKFWSLIDHVNISLYPDKITKEQLEIFSKNKKIQINSIDSFYKLTPTKSDEETLDRYQRCWNKFCLSIDEGYFYRCPESIYIPALFLNSPRETDGIPLKGLTLEKFLTFLSSPVPLKSCAKCFNFECSERWSESKKPWDDQEIKDLMKDNEKFDEDYYLLNNPDVEHAVKAGQYTSGMHHYLLHGKNENRICSK